MGAGKAEELPPAEQYFTLTALEDGCRFWWQNVQATGSGVYYSLNKGITWTFIGDKVQTPPVNAGKRVLFKASITPYFWDNYNETWRSGIGKMLATKQYAASGNPLSLIYGDDFKGKVCPSGGVSNLFKKTGTWVSSAPSAASANAQLIDASGLYLPSTGSNKRCYGGLFYDCINLLSVRCLLTNGTNANDITARWMTWAKNTSDCTFVKRAGINWNRNENGIPSNWVVKEETV